MSSYSEFKKNIKALQELEKYNIADIRAWVTEALLIQYPSDYKKAFEILWKKSWNEIQGEIINLVDSQEFTKIHELREYMLKTDLLFNPEILKRMKRVVDLGNLAVFNGKQNLGLFLACSVGNSMFFKDAKLESYLLYLSLNGKPRLRNGFFSKF